MLIVRPTTLPLALSLALVPACFSPDPSEMSGTGMDSTTTDPGGNTTGDPDSGAASTSAVDGTGMVDGSTGDTETIDFEDDFSQDLGQWMFRDDPGAAKEGPGDWAYVGGDLVQRADISGPETATPSLGTFAIGGDNDWDSYVVDVTYTADDDGVAGLLCHVTDNGDYVRIELDHETGIVRLVRSTGGALTILDQIQAFEVPMMLEVERAMTLECGATYRGFIDDVPLVEAAGDVDTEGGVGMYASSIGDGPVGLAFHAIEVEND